MHVPQCMCRSGYDEGEREGIASLSCIAVRTGERKAHITARAQSTLPLAYKLSCASICLQVQFVTVITYWTSVMTTHFVISEMQVIRSGGRAGLHWRVHIIIRSRLSLLPCMLPCAVPSMCDCAFGTRDANIDNTKGAILPAMYNSRGMQYINDGNICPVPGTWATQAFGNSIQAELDKAYGASWACHHTGFLPS